MKGAARIISPVFVLAGIGILAIVTWSGLSRWRDERALASHLESGKSYRARVLDEIGVLPDELRESSGLAVSRTQPGVLWSHNDSGDGPNLYAIDQSGRLLAIVPVTNAMAQDWEDISSGPCPIGVFQTDAGEGTAEGREGGPGASSCLYVADTGNNDRLRDTLTVYVMVEPLLNGAKEPPAVTARSFHYRYPDGRHDAEAIAVVHSGDVTIISKDRTGTIDFFGISAASVARAIASAEVLTAERKGSTGIVPEPRIGRLVTAAAVSPDGRTLAVRTYYEVLFYAAAPDGGWRDLQRPCSLGDAEPQGEAIDYLDDKTLLLTSERSRGRPGTIHRLQC